MDTVQPAPHHPEPTLRKWCRYLARGGRLTRAGMHHCVARNAGELTFSTMNRLQAAGLIVLEPTPSDTPALRHMRAVLTPEGHRIAALPELEGAQ